MFTYKFIGLELEDAPTQYYYGSVPIKPVLGTVFTYDETNNRYLVIKIEGEGLKGNASTAQEKLAWAEIGGGEKVPTIWLQRLRRGQKSPKKVSVPEQKPKGRSFTAEEFKEQSQRNRKMRLRRKISN